MKKIIFILLSINILVPKSILSCGGYDPSYDFFNLFTQTIISNKAFAPFLLSYSSPFYEAENTETANWQIVDKNIEDWQKYFDNELSYAECKTLVYDLPMEDLNALKRNNTPQNTLAQNLPSGFYQKYKEGIDYLIEAKYLQPYMRIQHQPNEDSWSYYDDEKNLDATDLKYEHTIAALKSLYQAARHPQIKLRYGYQLVRFYHYTRHMEEAMRAFDTFITPLKLHSAVYYLALDQYAGAQRSAGFLEEANWNFFQVFLHSNTHKKSAYSSLRFSDDDTFNKLLQRARNNTEKTMAYFLLGYQAFNNPLPMMQKIADIDPKSEALMVLEARAINELESNLLLCYYPTYSTDDKHDNISPKKTQKLSLWQRIIRFFSRFFKNLFGIKNTETKEVQHSKNRLLKPIDFNSNTPNDNQEGNRTRDIYNQLIEITKLTQSIREKTTDAFWDIAYAYLCFLQGDYEKSQDILSALKTQNNEYQKEIVKISLLNDIVSQGQIDHDFEIHMMQNYGEWISTLNEQYGYHGLSETGRFVVDILANRYHLQGEDAKSFLMNNRLTDLQYNPNIQLTKKLETFYKKQNKSALEEVLLQKMLADVKHPMSFFALIYGDKAMQEGQFAKAQKYYKAVKDGQGFIPTKYSYWDYKTDKTINSTYAQLNKYDGFNRISNLVFGHNQMESFNSPVDKTMQEESFIKDFACIKPQMNKMELAEALIRLQELAKTKDEHGSEAHQLIGNLLYNTSKLGYFRHLFVMDISNGNGPKYHFNKQTEHPQQRYYYKGYVWEYNNMNNNFELAKSDCRQAACNTNNKERKARILFQLASIEQGEYYQWVENQPSIPYEEEDWWQKTQAQEKAFLRIKREKFCSYFDTLKQDYQNTQTVKSLEQSCSYFENFINN